MVELAHALLLSYWQSPLIIAPIPNRDLRSRNLAAPCTCLWQMPFEAAEYDRYYCCFPEYGRNDAHAGSNGADDCEAPPAVCAKLVIGTPGLELPSPAPPIGPPPKAHVAPLPATSNQYS